MNMGKFDHDDMSDSTDGELYREATIEQPVEVKPQAFPDHTDEIINAVKNSPQGRVARELEREFKPGSNLI